MQKQYTHTHLSGISLVFNVNQSFFFSLLLSPLPSLPSFLSFLFLPKSIYQALVGCQEYRALVIHDKQGSMPEPKSVTMY